MYQHPALLEPLIRDRVAELRQSGPATARIAPTAPVTAIGRHNRRRSLVAAARSGTGWLLVDMGLRLAMPRGGANRPMARGQR